ncbi:glycosyltransferase family 39 protein [Streptomyces sp. P3]|uniref:ArnT family glycosyltransferase n=1 Tax=Streptomyces sp. P3 TaxID=2135430 RepID=UPI00131ED9FA|nr:phospholipid carrier-dependent glycosyltransferase [Streptomyces sp. P3]
MSRALPMPVAWLRAVPLWAVAVCGGLFTALLRLFGVGRGPDVFGDEIFYWRFGHSVAHGGFPRDDGGLFWLHPPGFFYLEGGWERLFGASADVVSGVYQMRQLNALLAGFTAVVLVLLTARVTRSTLAGVAVGAVFAIDPFILRINQRVLIETSAMLWVLLGYLVLLPLTERNPGVKGRRRAAAAGLLFGLAILTKDVTALVTVLPLLAATVFIWPSKRSLPLLAAGFAAVPYAIYVSTVAWAGHIDALWGTKTHGIRRLLGLVQETGFNSGKSTSLSQRLIEEMSSFGSTYVLLILAPLAVVPLLRRGGPPQRLLALWYVSATLALGYAVVKGTLEEQQLYLLIVPTIVILTMRAVQLWERRTERAPRAAVSRVAAVSMLTLTLAWSGFTFAGATAQPDDGYERLRQYMTRHVPAGSSITSMSESSSLLLEDRYRMGEWATPQARARERVAYVVVPWRIVEHNLSSFTPREARQLTRHGALLFSFHGRTYGTVELYRVPVPPPSLLGGRDG